ncbi:MAG: CehA/McbA family metallohydrolase [Clostridiales bacterium]|nr:CehA/McbA family metallohydrolase [Clostridiales bacterium]
MIRQAAFTEGQPLLKGGLHCHTTRSDGRGTPEEVIRKHVAHGYDFLALTDHRRYNYQNFAPGSEITILPGMEIDYNFDDEGCHCFHAVCLGPERAAGNGFEQDQTFESGLVRGAADFQPVLDKVHANGNITMYCHPEWSGTPARDFEDLRGNFAMEIWNTGCALENDMDTNAAYWDEILMQGQRIFGAAVDDGHQMDQHCVGYVMVAAENRPSAILGALTKGAFYSSCGPEIHDFYVEDGVAHIKCSPVRFVNFCYGRYPSQMVTAKGELVTEASFKVPPYFTYIRATMVDENGRRAWTNPIFLK